MRKNPESGPGQPNLFDKKHIDGIADCAAIRALVEGVKKEKKKKKQDGSSEER